MLEKIIPDSCHFLVASELPLTTTQLVTCTTDLKVMLSHLINKNPDILNEVMDKTDCVLFYNDMSTSWYKNEWKILTNKYNFEVAATYEIGESIFSLQTISPKD